MAFPSELKGLNGTICEDCGAPMILDVQYSNAGWYLGYFCGNCGPYSRETGYFATREKAEKALDAWLEECEVPANLRNEKYRPTDF